MAFMTTDQTALPSSSPTRWKYDVFLSFHGEDTRKSFTAHMYAALEQRGIYTFRDDEKLERGNYISLELLKAIKESKYAIIVFSINYAFSKWCLIELAKIVECMKENQLTVFPVFYHVDPSHVRNQRGTFAKAFVKHGKDPNIDIKRIQTWRAALEEVGNIAGWHLHDRDESTTIKEIVGNILSQLNRTCSSISEELFGIDSPVDEMCYLLRRKSDDHVRFVGICGMGGIGKTTLAEVVFYRFRHQFQATSFIGCVREESTRYRGLVSLQKQLLSQILKEEINIWDVRGGINMIKNRLFLRKVLIVLDDVDKEQQLEALAGNQDWFGPGSRIIVTSRDGHLLKRHVDDTYMVTGLGHANALQLFSWKAFKKPYPEETYVDLCKEFVKYANGLPLALTVLGSSLYGRRRNEWESARDKLKANPNREVLDVLEIGFDSLGVAERRLFLDIACFFKREIKKDLIIDLLESSGYPPHIDIAILVDKSLLTVCFGNSFWMHDLLQEMGQQIVRRESPEEPGQRSRLWLLEDAREMLSNNTHGTNVVEGIVLNSPFQEEENLNAETFSKMKKLRLLKIRYGQLPEDLSYLSNELRLLEWFGYPLKSFPSTFQPDKLVELRMPYSQIRQLWINGIKSLCKLKLIDLSYSRNLDKMPNFNKIPNLEKLILQECTSLSSVHQSIGVLKRLIVLNLRGCKSLANLPESVGSMECLKELDASDTAITRIPSSILLLKNLQNLSLHGCKGLAQKLGDPIFSSHWLLQKESSDPIGLPWRNTFSSLSSLRSLDLSDCNLLDGAIPDDLSGLSSLKSLNLSGNEFTSLTDGIYQVSTLKEVFFRNCSRLQALPKLPLGIAFVWAENCTSLNIYSDNQIYMWYRSSRHTMALNFSRLQYYVEKALRSQLETKHHLAIPSLRKLLEMCGSYVTSGSSWAAEIPEWFDKQSTSSSVTTPMQYPISSNNNEWKGCALFVIYEVHEFETSNFRISERSDSTLDLKDLHQFVFYFETNEGRLKQPLVLNSPKVPFVGSTGFCVYIPYVWFSEQSNKLDRWRYIVASITTGSPGVEVKKLGMRILYEGKDVQDEFIKSIVRCSPGLFFGERSTFRKVAQCMSILPTPHVGEAECVSMTCIRCPLSNEDHGLKGDLLSLLLQCFEVSPSLE